MGERGVKMFERAQFSFFFLLIWKKKRKETAEHKKHENKQVQDQRASGESYLSTLTFNYGEVITEFVQQSRSTQADKQGEEEEKEKWHDLKIPLKPHTATQQWHEDSFRDYKEWKFASVPLQSMSLFPVTKTRLNSEMFVCCSDLLFPNSSQVIHRSTAPPPIPPPPLL